MKLGRWLVALFVLLLARGGRRARERPPREERASARAELAVLVLLGLATLSAVAFVPIYALDSIDDVQTQLLGLALGCAFVFLAAALIVVAKALVPQGQVAEPYPPAEHEADNAEIERIVAETGSRVTRRRLLKLAGAGAGAALAAALVTPALSLGPLLDVSRLRRSVWRRGVRLVDSAGKPLAAAAVPTGTVVTAFPEGAPRNEVDAPVVVVRLQRGVVAYSKICTHAGCAVALYRVPLFPPRSPRPALVCPCHYSAFDPERKGEVLSGPAGRPLPQLPLTIDGDGNLRAAGGFSGPVGPSWWGVRRGG
jgi:ubiquinol-cytochrome c reductase iron-sulfur subunit